MMVGESKKDKDVIEFESKVIKLKLLLDNGIITQNEYLEIRQKMIKEVGIWSLLDKILVLGEQWWKQKQFLIGLAMIGKE